jgi:hypothetical protein
MSPEELLNLVYQFIDQCFAGGKDLGQTLVEIEDFLASFEKNP